MQSSIITGHAKNGQMDVVSTPIAGDPPRGDGGVSDWTVTVLACLSCIQSGTRKTMRLDNYSMKTESGV